MEDKKSRQMNERSLENLKLGADARRQGEQGKHRYNFTLLPETVNWLRGTGNASDAIDALVDSARNGGLSSRNTHNGKNEQAELEAKLKTAQQEISQLRLQLVETKEELEGERAEKTMWQGSAEQWQMVADHTQDQLSEYLKSPTANLETARDQFLAGLGRGKQSPEYKAAAKILSRFLAQLQK